jgi:hypothetical protein
MFEKELGSRGQEDPDVRHEREFVRQGKAHDSPLVISNLGKVFSGANGYLNYNNPTYIKRGQDKHALSHLSFHVEVKSILVWTS